MTSPARRSHPPSLLRLVERALVDHDLVARGDRVLVATSGGPDSLALLHTLAILGKKREFSLIAHGVDHGLRPGAAAELELASRLARSLDVPFGVSRVEVASGSNLQARARAARHTALARAAIDAGATAIALGHTADDRAETVLLRLLRGSGPRGLAALPPASPSIVEGGPPLVRPLILARRVDVLTHLARHRVDFAEDPSNRDPRFLRVRVRRELLPLLEELSPRVVEHLVALASMLEGLPDDPLASLGRAQRSQVLRAKRQGLRRVEVRLAGSRDVVVSFPRAGGVLIEDASSVACSREEAPAHCSSAPSGPVLASKGGGPEVDPPRRRSIKSC